MKSLIVRAGSLYVFNVVVLILIGMLLPGVRVGLSALWAGAILTAVTLALKPLMLKAFGGLAAKSLGGRFGERTLRYGVIFVAELIVWILTVWFSPVAARGIFSGYLLPPLLLLLAWAIYDRIDDVIEAKVGGAYDNITSRSAPPRPQSSPAPTPPPAPKAVRDELNDGLTPEQRRMLDEL